MAYKKVSDNICPELILPGLEVKSKLSKIFPNCRQINSIEIAAAFSYYGSNPTTDSRVHVEVRPGGGGQERDVAYIP